MKVWIVESSDWDVTSVLGVYKSLEAARDDHDKGDMCKMCKFEKLMGMKSATEIRQTPVEDDGRPVGPARKRRKKDKVRYCIVTYETWRGNDFRMTVPLIRARRGTGIGLFKDVKDIDGLPDGYTRDGVKARAKELGVRIF